MVINVIVPVLIILGAGYLFGKYVKVDYSPISKFSMIVLSPALIFSFLIRSNLSPSSIFQVVVVILVFTIMIAAVTVFVMKITDNKEIINPALLSTVFPNTGNFGLPILLFAYGEEAFSIGVIIVVVNFVLMYSLGVYFASLEGESWAKGIRNILKLPTTYATLLAVLVLTLQIPVPDFIYDPIKLMGDAMVPVVLLILGIQLSRTNIQSESMSMKGRYSINIAFITGIRLIGGPVITLGILALFTVEPLTAKVLILQNAMPTAVLMTMIAEEYKAQSSLVANATFINTIASVISITALLYLLETYL
ncbi:AEC family transporter [Robertmurraya sp. DFI.2.37]|uniref:AEC family transporter n=1 Tax=Robertmurraya sp. DFI.2.37 TaxID=3031819 RepID=UPI00124712BC|nr:AEC family transporter [Robertmurraya sp. DFI.2.37]MDF1506778.1 AEC family transporter [Robertmurraya sp. DFI.2.37]